MTTYVINPITNELESAQPRQRVADKFKLEDLLTPGPLRDELKGDFDPTQETYEEYLRRINLRYGGRVNFDNGGLTLRGGIKPFTGVRFTADGKRTREYLNYLNEQDKAIRREEFKKLSKKEKIKRMRRTPLDLRKDLDSKIAAIVEAQERKNIKRWEKNTGLNFDDVESITSRSRIRSGTQLGIPNDAQFKPIKLTNENKKNIKIWEKNTGKKYDTESAANRWKIRSGLITGAGKGAKFYDSILAIQDAFIRDPDMNVEELAKEVFGSDYEKGSLKQKRTFIGYLKNDVPKFLEAMAGTRKVPGFKKMSDDVMLDVIDNINSNKSMFGFYDETFRQYNYKIRDMTLGIDPNTSLKQRTELLKLKKGMGLALDETAGLAATFERAPGYTSGSQLIDQKLNIMKAKIIDKRFSNVLKAMLDKDPNKLYKWTPLDSTETKKVTRGELVKLYNDHAKYVKKKHKIDTPTIEKNVTPEKAVKNFELYSKEEQINMKQLYKKNKFSIGLGKETVPLKSLLENFGKNINDIKKFGNSKGFTLNSFAGILNFSDANIEIPESVKSALKKVAPVIKGAGYATGPLATIPFVQQAERGLPLGAVIETGLARTAEDIVNLPALLYGGGKFLKEKLSGKEAEFELPYEADFGRRYSDFIEKNIPLKERQDRIKDFEIPRGVVDDMELLSDQEFDKMSEVYPEKFKDLMKASEKPQIEPENLDLTEQDNQVLDSFAQGGRVGFQDGTPPVIPGNEPDYSELQVMLDNPDKYNTFPKGTFAEEMDKAVYGTNEERNLLQKFNSMFLNPRVYPYYAQKLTSGAANIPELAFRFPASLGYLYGQSNLALATADFDRISGKTLMEALEILDPKYTREIKNTKLGDAIGISDKSMNEQDKTEGQKFVGDIFELGAEAVGPATPLFLFKMFPKLSKQIKDLVGTATAAEKVNKEIEKNMAVDQTRRDLILTIGAGGAVAALKFLGLDKLIKAPKATKAVTSAVKSGGTPQYFFDFVDLIKRKGKDVSDTQAVVERQRVIEYKDYTLTDTDGYVTIRKTDEEMGRDEMMEYKPPEGVVDEATGTAKEVPAQYDEATSKPDPNDPGNFDSDSGFESIDEVLQELAEDGKKYTIKELEEMDIHTFVDDDVFPSKVEKAEGGIIAGVKSGPAPKSGPTPHGLPYLAKNVTPIKERK